VRLHLRRAIQVTVENAISQNSLDQAARILYRAAHSAQSLEAFIELRTIIEKTVSKNVCKSNAKIAVAYTRSLAGSGDTANLLEFLQESTPQFQGTDLASLELYLASALHRTGDSVQALRTLTRIWRYLNGFERGLAFAYLGSILRALHHPKWFVPFEKMRMYLQGRNLGVQIVNEGHCWFLERDRVRSSACFREAIQLLEHDHVNKAMSRFNLGMNLLRECDLGASAELETVERSTRGVKYAQFRPRFLAGLAMSYSTQRDWPAAQRLYNRVLEISNDDELRGEANLNLGRIYRLSGHPAQAINPLGQTLLGHPIHHDSARVERASIHLIDGGLEAAQSLLDRALHPLGGDADLKKIVQAEIERRHGNLERMRNLLEAIEVQERVAREEVQCWPELWAQARVLGVRVPEPLPEQPQLTVEVQALGKFCLTINAVTVECPPRVGEFLVFLLEQGGKTTNENVMLEFFAERQGDVTQGALNDLTRRLRETLGSHSSLQSIKGERRLSTAVVWHYDVARLRNGELGQAQGLFLEGSTSAWVRRVRLRLGQSG
jgi:tetratricopeptide (TPR) repeat protein